MKREREKKHIHDRVSDRHQSLFILSRLGNNNNNVAGIAHCVWHYRQLHHDKVNLYWYFFKNLIGVITADDSRDDDDERG